MMKKLKLLICSFHIFLLSLQLNILSRLFRNYTEYLIKNKKTLSGRLAVLMSLSLERHHKKQSSLVSKFYKLIYEVKKSC